MNGHGQKLNRNQEKAIAALLAHPSIPAAAKAIKVGVSTLSRWLKVSSFQAVYRSARKQVVSFAIAKMQTAMMEAVDTLKTVMNDPEVPVSTRVAAARTILDLGVKSLEIEIIKDHVSKDHVHLFVSVPSYHSVSQVMKRIKGKTSRRLLSESRILAKQ